MTPSEEEAVQAQSLSSRRALLTGGGIGALAMLAQSASAQGAKGGLNAFFNVREFGAKGDANSDDTPAIQAAIDAAVAQRYGIVYFPPQEPHRGYRLKRTLRVSAPISIVGAGASAATLMATGFKTGQILLDFDCRYEDVIREVLLSGLTLRSDDSRATGIRLKNAAYVLMKQLVMMDMDDGVVITGRGSYSISFEQFTAHPIARYSVWFNAASGGFYSFLGSTFSGKSGVFIDDASGLNGVGFVNCNFEQCTASSLHAAGDVLGLSISGCRTEGCDGDDFLISPVTGKLVAGLSITGCYFTSDNGKSRPIVLGGAGGRVRGFNICGNYAGHAGDTFVYANREAGSGVIAGNYLSREIMKASNAVGDGIRMHGNENSRRKLPDQQ